MRPALPRAVIRRPLSARRVLVVAPHPDDEAIGAWALMRRLGGQGARIEVVVVTDGAASHPGSPSWPLARLVAERRRETRRALATLALPPSRLRFLSLADGALEAGDPGLHAALSRALRRRPPPQLIVGPSVGDAHPDHHAVATALARIRRRGERRLGYRVWPENARPAARGVRVALDGQQLCAKRRIVRGYRTQAGLIADSETGFTMTPRHLRAFAGPDERFEILA